MIVDRHRLHEFHLRPAVGSARLLAAAISAMLFGFLVLPAGAQEARTDRVRIEYVPAKNPEYQSLLDSLKANHGLEKMQETFAPFRLSTDLNLRAMECGMANAWYQRGR